MKQTEKEFWQPKIAEGLGKYWKDDSIYPNFIRYIAAHNGWNPLAVGESMTVGFDGEEYTITRNKNRYD